MSYDDDFYARYESYLEEPGVRAKHDALFDLWVTAARKGSRQPVPIDLGCGRGQEYMNYCPGTPIYYGFDANVNDESSVADASSTYLFKADYRDPGFIERVKALQHEPDVFVSLFSAENTATPSENQELYERLFTGLPSLTHALVAGFYYSDRRDENPVVETGGIVSFQTLPWIERESKVYDETRLVTPVPSDLFGPKVVEVWRILERR